MIFASVELAARVEWVECDYLRCSAESVRSRHPERSVECIPLAGGCAVHFGTASPLNKIAGLGFGGPVEEKQLDAIEHKWAERDIPVRVELSTLGDPALGGLFSRRGYHLHAHESVLGRAIRHGDSFEQTAQHDLQVQQVGTENFELWLETMVAGFLVPEGQGVEDQDEFAADELRNAILDSSFVDGVYLFLATRNGEPAGSAGLCIIDGVAQLCGASTLPEHRRRGVQGLLLKHRLAVAAKQGCDLAVIVTLPGSKSQQNAQKRGFELLYSRATVVLDNRSPQRR